MSNYQAAVQAGYSHSTAINAKKNIEKHGVRKLMEEIMEDRGLSDIKLVEILKEGLQESTKTCNAGGNFITIPDYAVRHRYLETALKLKGKLTNNQSLAVTNNNERVEIMVTAYGENDPLIKQHRELKANNLTISNPMI